MLPLNFRVPSAYISIVSPGEKEFAPSGSANFARNSSEADFFLIMTASESDKFSNGISVPLCRTVICIFYIPDFRFSSCDEISDIVDSISEMLLSSESSCLRISSRAASMALSMSSLFIVCLSCLKFVF